MIITPILNEQNDILTITPSIVSKYVKSGIDVIMPEKCGKYFSIDEYTSAGATVEKFPHADIFVGVRPDLSKLSLQKGAVLVISVQREDYSEQLKKLKEQGITCCILERIPRISRAQNMDILSSQANIAGYRAVLEALQYYQRVVPLMMTAAGTIRPAKVLVVGAGVAGLQAIATAKRLGAVVSAFDVRAAAKEQVESLGASFVDVENDDSGETSGGYAKEMSEDYKKRQAEKLTEAVAKSDIVITTAQIPNKPAPKLITKEMVDAMTNGSVIVDMAVASGGNCELSQQDKVIMHKNVTILGCSNLAEKVAFDAGQLLACNIYNFIQLLVKDGKIDTSDEIVQATLF